MRLVVLCMDGLDPRHVETLKLHGLAQEHRGTHRVDTRHNSVQLWRAFLTGRDPGSFEDRFVEAETPRWARALVKALPYAVKRRLYMLRAKPPTTPVEDTFIASATRPLVFNMFAYNEEREQFKLRLKYSLPRIVGNTEASTRAFLDWEEWTLKLMSRFYYSLIMGVWNLAVTHIYITDIAGHLAVKPSLSWMVPRAYRLADWFTARVREAVRDTAILVVSDHGMRRGQHTPEGFWSLNVEPPLHPQGITDFKRLVEVILHEY